MQRLPSLTPDQMNAAQRQVHGSITSGPRGTSLGALQGPFAPLLYSPEMTQHVEQLGVYLRYNCTVPIRQRELAICIIGAHWQADFEWFTHAPIAQEQGVPAAALSRIAARQDPDLSDPLDQITYEVITELHTTRRLSDALYARAVEAFGAVGMVELTGLVGYYTLLAMTLNTFEVAVPQDADIPWRQKG